jgi:hypothetical protein
MADELASFLSEIAALTTPANDEAAAVVATTTISNVATTINDELIVTNTNSSSSSSSSSTAASAAAVSVLTAAEKIAADAEAAAAEDRAAVAKPRSLAPRVISRAPVRSVAAPPTAAAAAVGVHRAMPIAPTFSFSGGSGGGGGGGAGSQGRAMTSNGVVTMGKGIIGVSGGSAMGVGFGAAGSAAFSSNLGAGGGGGGGGGVDAYGVAMAYTSGASAGTFGTNFSTFGGNSGGGIFPPQHTTATTTTTTAVAASAAQGVKRPLIRTAAGESWVDPTLEAWPENDYRIFVGNFGPEVTEEMLAQPFRKFASFVKCRVVHPKIGAGKVRPYGFLSFLEPMDALAVLKTMQGAYIGTRPITVQKSNWLERNLDTVRAHEREEKKAKR